MLPRGGGIKTKQKNKQPKPNHSFESSLYWTAFFPSPLLFYVFRLLYVWQLSLGVRAETTEHDCPFYRQQSQPRTILMALLFKSWSLCLNNKSQDDSCTWMETPGCLFPPSHYNPFGHIFFLSVLYLFSSVYFPFSCFFFFILAAKLLFQNKTKKFLNDGLQSLCRYIGQQSSLEEPGPIGLWWDEMPAPNVEAEPSGEGWALSWLSSCTDALSFSHLGSVSFRQELGVIWKEVDLVSPCKWGGTSNS